MDRFEICELVIIGVDAHAEEQAGVSPIDNLGSAELDEVGLVLLVSRRDETVDLYSSPKINGENQLSE